MPDIEVVMSRKKTKKRAASRIPDNIEKRVAVEAPVPEAEYTVALPAALKDLPPPEAPKKPSRRSLWAFAFLNLLLIALILFLGVQAVQNITDLALGPETAAVPPPVPPPKQVLAAKEPPAPAKALPVEKISIAPKNLGLKLVGTVVAEDANRGQAVIESSKNREQKVFCEGDQIGKVRIKKIQRNQVVITTEEGDRLLTLDPESFAKNGRASSLEQGLDRQSQIRPVELGLTRDFVTRFLGDPDEFLQNMQISPYTEDDRPAGFQITGITPNNPLGKMGLLDGDVITAINQEAITSPQQAPDFLRKLIKGGKIEIRVNRNRSRRLVRLNIE